MNYTINGNKITITGHFLKVMEQNGLVIYHTPESLNIYVASRPSWKEDECVVTPEHILYENGYTDSEDLEDDEEFVLVIDVV